MSSDEKLLLKIQGFLFFAGSLSGVFQNIFIFRLGNFRTVVLYDLLALSTLFILYLFSGKLLNRYSSRTLMRSGLTMFTIVNLCFFSLKENAIEFVVPLALATGIGHGLFWPGNNLSQYILTQTGTRNKYFGNLNFIFNIASTIAPLIGGLIIWFFSRMDYAVWGYATLFLIVAIIYTYLFFVSKQLPRHSGIEFSFLHILRHKRVKKWKIILTQQFIFGLWDVAFSAISGVLIFLIVKEEFILGTVKTLMTLIFALGSLIAGSILQKRSSFILPAGILSSIGILMFGLQQNWLGLAFLIVIVGVFQPFLNISTSKSIYDTIDDLGVHWRHKYHFLVERDTVLGIGRIINYLILLMLFNPENQIAIAKSWILVIPIFPIVIGLLQNKYFKESLKTRTEG